VKIDVAVVKRQIVPDAFQRRHRRLIGGDGRIRLLQLRQQASALRFPAKENVGRLGLLRERHRLARQCQRVREFFFQLVELRLITQSVGKRARVVDRFPDLRRVLVGREGLQAQVITLSSALNKGFLAGLARADQAKRFGVAVRKAFARFHRQSRPLFRAGPIGILEIRRRRIRGDFDGQFRVAACVRQIKGLLITRGGLVVSLLIGAQIGEIIRGDRPDMRIAGLLRERRPLHQASLGIVGIRRKSQERPERSLNERIAAGIARLRTERLDVLQGLDGQPILAQGLIGVGQSEGRL
jgi:hypothetical protein